MKKIFTELSNLTGISGDEGDVKQYLRQKLSPYKNILPDNLGNLIVQANDSTNGSKIMFAAHMDEIGFLSGHVTKEGFIEMIPIGGWYAPVALGGKVLVKTPEKNLIGIISSVPPHLLTPEERKAPPQLKNMYIDIGASNKKEVTEKFRVFPNTPICPYPDSGQLNTPDLLYGKAWDDRLGCAALIETREALSSENLNNEIYYVGTVQEEVGIRGAKTAAHIVNPDVAIVLEITVAHDYPKGNQESPAKLGEGVSISFYDRSMLSHRGLFNYMVSLAEQHDIKYHFNYSLKGGTDGGNIHLAHQGIPTIVLGVPTRYIHSFYSVFNMNDFREMIKLTTLFTKNFQPEVLEKY